jgi:hypothetical protein
MERVGWNGMERILEYSNKHTLKLIKEVPDSVYKHVLLDIPPESANPSPDIIFALRVLLTDSKMASVWKKLVKKAIKKNKEHPGTSVDRFLVVTFSLVREIYRKNRVTAPYANVNIGGVEIEFKDSKYRRRMNNHIRRLQELLRSYPHSYEFFLKHSDLSTIGQALGHLFQAIDGFNPEGPTRNAMFLDASKSRKAHGTEGRKTYFIQQCSHGFSDIYSEPMHEIVADLASQLFPDSGSSLTEEDVRQRTTVRRKKRKIVQKKP